MANQFQAGNTVYIQKHSEITRFDPAHPAKAGGKVGIVNGDLLPGIVSVTVGDKSYGVRLEHLVRHVA
jgi:hypothetical protein